MNYIVKKNNMISMIRGNSFSHIFKFEVGEFPRVERLSIGEDDLIYFGIMYPNDYFEHCIIKKEFTKDDLNSEGDLVVKLEPEDTTLLYPGTYYYEIKLLKSSSEEVSIDTLVQKTKFIILD